MAGFERGSKVVPVASIMGVCGVKWDEINVRDDTVYISWKGLFYVFPFTDDRDYLYKVGEFIRKHQTEVSFGDGVHSGGYIYVDEYVTRQEGSDPVQRGQGLDDSFGLGEEDEPEF